MRRPARVADRDEQGLDVGLHSVSALLVCTLGLGGSVVMAEQGKQASFCSPSPFLIPPCYSTHTLSLPSTNVLTTTRTYTHLYTNICKQLRGGPPAGGSGVREALPRPEPLRLDGAHLPPGKHLFMCGLTDHRDIAATRTHVWVRRTVPSGLLLSLPPLESTSH